MAHYPYIILRTSDYGPSGPSGPGYSYKFRVPEGGWIPTLHPAQNLQTTLAGVPDISQGGVYESRQYAIRLKQTEDEEGYGDYDDLVALFMLKNPNASPSDVLTLIDHYGNELSVIITGDHVPQPQSVIIEGTDAYFIVPLTFQVVA